MRIKPIPIDPRPGSRAEPCGGNHALMGLGLRQRESLCRGIAFVFVLALSCLLVIYAPIASEGLGRSANTLFAAHPSAHPVFTGRDRTASSR